MKSNLPRWIGYNLRYIGKPPWDSGVSPPELYEFIQKTSPGRALDLGAGTGTNMVTLALAGWKVEGVEYAFIAVCAARKKLRKMGAPPKIYCREVTKLDFLTGKYDLILDIGCFHGLSSSRRLIYIENLKTKLAINGTFLLYAFLSQTPGQVGVSEKEIEELSGVLPLVNSRLGLDRGDKASQWLEFQNKQLD